LPGGLHGVGSGLRGEERALENDVEEPVVLRLGHFDERLRREDTGVVEKYIDATETLDRGFHHRFAGRRQSDVAYVHSDTLARRAHPLRSRLGLGGIAAIDDNRTPFRDESGRALLADPRSTAGHDRDFVLETHLLFSCVSTYR